MVLPNRPSNNTPIPNNPFYSPLSDYLGAASGPLVVGNGLTVNYQTGEIEVLISATPVTGLQAGTGINIANLGSGVFEISSTGVQGLIPGYGITISPQPFGQYLISTTCAQGTVTSVTAGAGLTGGIITTAGTIALRIIDPPVSGCYTNPSSLTVDTYGRVTSATCGVPSIPLGIFGAKGQLAVGVGPSQAVALSVGPNTQVLTADSSCPTGLKWAPVGETAVSCILGAAPICVSGPSFNPTISIQPATLTSCGAVRLINSTNSPSADAALTAAAGCCLQQQIFALAPYSGTVSSVSAVAPVCITGNPTVNPTISVASASVSSPGVVQLNDTTCSASNTQALTANQGRSLQNQINALATGLGANLAGTFNGSLNEVINATPTGTSLGFVPGNPLPAAAPANASYYVIVEVPGTMTPPGGVPTAVGVGDWWLSDGFDWVFLNVGASPPSATTTVQGVVELATNAETQAGTDTTRAIVPSALQSKLSDCCNLASSTTIASSQAVKLVYDIAITGGCYATQTTQGTVCLATINDVWDGTSILKVVTPAGLQAKISDSTTLPNSYFIASSLALATVNATASGAVQNCLVTNSGQILVSCQSGCVRNFPNAPNNGCVLTSCTSSPYGLCWAPPGGGGGGGVTSITAGTGLTGGTITTSGTIALASTGVIAGTYDIKENQYNMAVNSQGQITSMEFLGYAFFSTTPPNGGSNTGLGFCSGLDKGSGNVGVGEYSLYQPGFPNPTAAQLANNVAVGFRALQGPVVSGSTLNLEGNVAIGNSSLCDAETSIGVVAIGTHTLRRGAQCTVAIGRWAGCNLDKNSINSVAIGNESLYDGVNVQNICEVTAIGAYSLSQANVNNEGVAIGIRSGYCSNSFASSTYVGGRSGESSCGSFNTFLGGAAGYSHKGGCYNTFLGFSAGSQTAGTICNGFCCTIVIGACSGQFVGGCLQCGVFNTIIGTQTARGTFCGNHNIVIGSCASQDFYCGNNSIFIGSCVLNANCSTCVYNNAIYIGNSLNFICGEPDIGVCNVVAIGNFNTTSYKIFGTWTNISDQKFKTCVCDSALGLSFLKKVQPREFIWCYSTEAAVNGKRCIGIVAQEVLQAVCATPCAEHLGVVEVTEDTHWSSPTAFTWPLINAVKELSAENTALKTRLDDLEARLTALGG